MKLSMNVSGFIAQVVRASHRCREVTGSNPVEVLTFSGFHIPNCILCVNNCEDRSSLDNDFSKMQKKTLLGH